MVPLIGRSISAAVGALLVLTAAASVTGTLIVPRPVGGWLTRWVDRIVNGAFRIATSAVTDYRRRDRVLAGQAAAILLGQLTAWLGISFSRVLAAAVAVRQRRRAVRVDRCRVLAVHPRVRGAGRGRALGHRLRRGGDRSGNCHAADRLPADAVRGVQP